MVAVAEGFRYAHVPSSATGTRATALVAGVGFTEIDRTWPVSSVDPKRQAEDQSGRVLDQRLRAIGA